MDDAKVFFPFSVLGFLIRSFQQVLAHNHPFFVKWSITCIRRRELGIGDEVRNRLISGGRYRLFGTA